MEKLCRGWGFKMLKFWFFLVLFFCWEWLQHLSKIFDLWRSCCLLLHSSHHLGSLPYFDTILCTIVWNWTYHFFRSLCRNLCFPFQKCSMQSFPKCICATVPPQASCSSKYLGNSGLSFLNHPRAKLLSLYIITKFFAIIGLITPYSIHFNFINIQFQSTMCANHW
jgi:hypothetical protein